MESFFPEILMHKRKILYSILAIQDLNLVPEVRLELTRFYPADFESAASTIPPPGETSCKEEVEVYQVLVKKAMD